MTTPPSSSINHSLSEKSFSSTIHVPQDPNHIIITSDDLQLFSSKESLGDKTSIEFNECELNQDIIELLDRLQSLKKLSFVNCTFRSIHNRHPKRLFQHDPTIPISYNENTGIHIRRYESLEELSITNCDVEELILDHLPNLIKLNFNSLPKLQHLIITNCDEMKDLNLDLNNLTNLIISCRSLKSLNIVKLHKLETLEVHSHELKILYISRVDNPKISLIYMSECRLLQQKINDLILKKNKLSKRMMIKKNHDQSTELIMLFEKLIEIHEKLIDIHSAKQMLPRMFKQTRLPEDAIKVITEYGGKTQSKKQKAKKEGQKNKKQKKQFNS